jgi:hypothetical protein
MTDIVLRDIDPVLAERIRRIGEARGWSASETLQRLLEHGLHVVEGDGAVRLDPKESDVLSSAISAMEQVPNDPGFALIGRTMPPLVPAPEGPDQSVSFELE